MGFNPLKKHDVIEKHFQAFLKSDHFKLCNSRERFPRKRIFIFLPIFYFYLRIHLRKTQLIVNGY